MRHRLFFNPAKWLKTCETGYPKQIFKTRKRGLFYMPAFFSSKKYLCLCRQRAANFSSMQIIEFLSAKQQRNVFDDIDYLSNMSKYELSIRIEMVLDEAIFTVAVLSIFCNNKLLQISDMPLRIKHLCWIPFKVSKPSL